MFMLLHQPLASRYLIFSLSNDSLRAILGETQTDDEDSAMQMLKLWLFATLLGISQLGRASPGGITLIGNEGCFDGNAAKSQFEKVLLNEHQDGQPPPKVSVAVSKTTTSLNVSLRVLNHKGGLMLSRSYTLSPQDCPEVPALLTLVLDEALKTLPLETWSQEPIKSSAEQRDVPHRLFVLAASEATHFTPALAVGAHLFFWRDDQIGAFGTVQTGFGPWFDLEQGTAQELTVLIGLGLSIEAAKLLWSSQLLVGGASYRGISTPNSETTLLPYAEAAGELGIPLGQSTLTFRLSLPVLRHTLSVEGTSTERPLEPLRLGLGLSIPL